MKKILLLTGVFVLSVTFTFAQFAEKGSMLFNGSLSFYAGKEKTFDPDFEEKISSYSFSPMFQYFIIDNLSIGASANTGFSTSKTDSFESSSLNFTFGPVVRYYAWEALFVQGYFGFGSGTNKSEFGQGSDEDKTNVMEWVMAGGYSIRITDNVLLDPMLGYWFNSVKYDDDDYNGKVNKGQICLQVGFTILINK